MIDFITEVNDLLNGFIWGVPAMTCIIGVGLYLSIRSGFVQLRKFGYSMKCTIGRIFDKTTASSGALTPFQAVCTALAATVGTGNIAGVAGAIAIGGPGAVFWMWISAPDSRRVSLRMPSVTKMSRTHPAYSNTRSIPNPECSSVVRCLRSFSRETMRK